jgi:hypothetical protein
MTGEGFDGLRLRRTPDRLSIPSRASRGGVHLVIAGFSLVGITLGVGTLIVVWR